MHQASFSKLLRVGAGSLVAVGLAAVIGCAVGTDPGVDVTQLDSLPAEAGPAVDGGSTTVLPPPSTQPTSNEGDDAGDDSGGSGGGDDGGSDAGTDAAVAPDSGGGGTTSCTSPNICSAATDLGSVSGDTGADVKTASGSGSQWFTVRVTENDSSITAVSLIVKAELTSPPGTNFDVFVYVAGGSSGQECSAVNSSSTNASGLDTAKSEFGESGLFSNGSDDSRTVSVEVRWISGTCSAATPWTLTIRGDTP